MSLSCILCTKIINMTINAFLCFCLREPNNCVVLCVPVCKSCLWASSCVEFCLENERQCQKCLYPGVWPEWSFLAKRRWVGQGRGKVVWPLLSCWRNQKERSLKSRSFDTKFCSLQSECPLDHGSHLIMKISWFNNWNVNEHTMLCHEPHTRGFLGHVQEGVTSGFVLKSKP